MKREVLTIFVRITGVQEVKGHNGEALMISFDGTAESEWFKANILPGGIDTQKQETGELRSLSARYMLEGMDYTGQACKIFIENEGYCDEHGNVKTIPKIYTDSHALAFLESANLTGTITQREGGVTIHIHTEEQ